MWPLLKHPLVPFSRAAAPRHVAPRAWGDGAGSSSGRAGIVAFVLFSTALLSPNIAALSLMPPSADRVESLGLALALWATWSALCGSLFVACALAAPLLLATVFELYLLFSYHTPLLPHVFGIIHDTNLAEASEFLAGLWLPIAVAAAGTVIFATWALRALWIARPQWHGSSRLWTVVVVVGGLAALHFAYEKQEESSAWLQPAPDEFRITPWPLVFERLRETFPFGLPLRYVLYTQEIDALERARSKLAHFKFGIVPPAASSERQVYVLVIGESSRFDRWAVDGYARPTSPRLSAEPHLIALSEVVSVASNTRMAVPALLTRKPATYAAGSIFPERSLISAFREAGFSTYWLSNQAMVGHHDTPISVYAREAEHVTYYNMSDAAFAAPYDAVLLAPLKRILATPEPRQLIVLHTLGSHADYRNRYPTSFRRFQPVPAPDAPVSLRDPVEAEQINNAYDNSILYTDWFLGEVLTAVKQTGHPLGAMLYVSDHGEDLMDRTCRNFGHGRPTRANYRVPLFFWYSDAYAARFPQRIRALEANRHAPLTTETVFPTLLEAAGLHFASENLRRSAMSPTLKPWPRMVATFTSFVDFDRAKVNPQCELTE